MEHTYEVGIADCGQAVGYHQCGALVHESFAKTHGIIVSVSGVRTSPDLSVAKVYLSIFPSEQSAAMMRFAFPPGGGRILLPRAP